MDMIVEALRAIATGIYALTSLELFYVYVDAVVQQKLD